MAMLIGISNEHEFYSQHFLDEELERTIETVVTEANAKEKANEEEVAKKKEQGITVDRWRTPWARLNTAARETLKAMNQTTSFSDAKSQIQAEVKVIRDLLQILDLPFEPRDRYLENGLPLPLLGEVKTVNGAPYLWIFHASDVAGAERNAESEDAGVEGDIDPMELCVASSQLTQNFALSGKANSFVGRNWLHILTAGVLTQELAPRWVLLCGTKQWVLIDRTKFAQRRVLRFDWTEILSRRESHVLQATAILLGQEAFMVKDGQCYLDRLDEKSYKHAHGVSEDLKYALRESIELLGNEAAKQLRQLAAEQRKGFFSGKNELDAKQLSDECLRYMYRLLFLFFVESRPELNYAPVGDDAYLKGYSLEALRDLEMIPLVNEAERNGHYFHETIDRLFTFFEEGTPEDSLLAANQCATKNAFRIEPLKSTLFDPNKMRLLKNVTFPNHVLQKVIELMSLSREATDKKKSKRRGRISYAHLGLNQLGAVYEALLSYSGFFAKEPLYEVKKKDVKGNPNPLDPAYFVTQAELDDYIEDEKVFDNDPVTGEKVLRRYEKGQFIYRMAGSARENSASYYTPEVLTKCLVEETLEVLVKQQLDELPNDEARAKKILTWRICEPAMGSAAFLNEAVNQVAELYMHYAMKVPGAKPLTQTQYRHELQRVKMFLADRNIYGVDLNPIAVELAEVSLWLNALSDDKYVPWFGLQLHTGNSLIGCRREAFWKDDLKKSIKSAQPHKVGPAGLQPGEIWHFLVPNEGMSNYKDKDVAKLEPEAMAKFKKWRTDLTKKYADHELDQLEMLSMQIEIMWQTWADKLYKLDVNTTDAYSIYGHEEKEGSKLSYQEKLDLVEMVRHGDGSLDSGEFGRLKLVMDYWCALWFWPIKEVEHIPTRQEFLSQVNSILSGIISPIKSEGSDLFAQESFEQAQTEDASIQQKWANRVRDLERRYDAVRIANRIAERERFLHWPLRFATVFIPQNGEHEGFDLTLGNPPWKVASWNSGGVLGDKNPKYLIHDKEYSAKGIQDVVLGKRDVVDGKTFFERYPDIYLNWLEAYESTAGSQGIFNSEAMYPELKGSASDLFKLFLPTVWRHSSETGAQGLVHPETVYTETKGQMLRLNAYQRLRKHYQFANEQKLFVDIDNNVEFSLNIYGKFNKIVNFDSINNLFIPRTIKSSEALTTVPLMGQKDDNGNWNTHGHPDRILHYDNQTLSTVAEVFGTDPEAPLLPMIHAKSLLTILEKFAHVPSRLGDLGDDLLISRMWDETNAKLDGTMRELPNNETVFPTCPEDAILNGPHINVGSPLFKTPDNPCISNKAWIPIDLTYIPDDFLPRVKYLPNVDRAEYLNRMQKVSWNGKPVTNFYRLALRAMTPTDGERQLTSALLPRGIAHSNIVESLAFKNEAKLLVSTGCFSSLPYDFYIRQQNKTNLLPAMLRALPDLNLGILSGAVKARTLALQCLTSYHADLYNRQFEDVLKSERWSTGNSLINQSFFADLTPTWQRSCSLRTDLERRQALLEIDVIVAQALGLTLEELQTCYRLGFRVMRTYDQETYYDQKGRIVFTPNGNGLRGVGFSRKANANDGETYTVNGISQPKGLGFEDIKDMTEGTVTRSFMDDTLPGGPRERTITYYAPFFKMNREEDYARAWTYFEAYAKEHKDN